LGSREDITFSTVALRQQQTETTVTSCSPPSRIVQGQQLGFTLIESLIAMAIAAVLATTALPEFSRWLHQQRLNSAAQQLLADLQLVRTEAVARQQGLRLSVRPAPSGSCYVLHTGRADACSCMTDDSGPARCDDGASEVKTVRWSTDDTQVRLHATRPSVLFDPVDGTSTPTTALEITNLSGQSLRHVVNVMGRVRTCAPGTRLLGYPAC
jgi:type IV fimbrial biogenesis protein FimT